MIKGGISSLVTLHLSENTSDIAPPDSAVLILLLCLFPVFVIFFHKIEIRGQMRRYTDY